MFGKRGRNFAATEVAGRETLIPDAADGDGSYILAGGVSMRATTIFVIALVAGLSAQNGSRSGVDVKAMDPRCKPCDDFWTYVNGGWLSANPIPASRSSWGRSSMLSTTNRDRLRGLLEAAAADTTSPPGSDVRKMGDFYASCMDTAAIDAHGLMPLKDDFDRIQAIQTKADLIRALIAFQHTGRPYGEVNGVVVGPFRVTSGVDPKNPDRVIARIVERDAPGRTGTSILSMPDRDYYLNDAAASRTIREAFVTHATTLLQLAGASSDDAARDARTVLALETSLAQSVMTIADKRDPDKTYHLMDAAGLRALAPAFDWARLLSDLKLPAATPVNVSEPELLRRVNTQLDATPVADWKTWLRWRVLKLGAPYLQESIAKEAFNFDRTVLAGVRQPPPRWETCVDIVDRDLSDVLAAAFVEKYFPASAKARMLALVENLRGAFREELEGSSWMQAATKRRAIEKLSALRVEVGYPSKWKSYKDVTVNRSALFDNVRSAWMAGQRRELQRIGRAVDRTEWAMNPPTVNAYSSAAMVVVVFPAGILQPPFFDPDADEAANYGGIGAVIGHEVGHQFDDGGSKFDATGRLNNWWSDEDRRTFDGRTGCVVEQFNTLDAGGGLHHNGRQVLGEALGDLGGLKIAYRAYRRSLAGKEPPVVDSFTGDQRFFIAFAATWGTQYRDEMKRLQIATNNHPLPQFRAIATLQNMPEFHRAFGCKDGDAMVRPVARQCSLW